MKFYNLGTLICLLSIWATTGIKVNEPFSRRFTLEKKAELICTNKAMEGIVCSIAKDAGALMLKGVGGALVEEKSGNRDIVTEVDKESQRIIVEGLKSAFPQHHVLAEEDLPTGIGAAREAIEFLQNEEHLWIIDPIDGTTNFVSGIPIAGVIISYASRGVTQFGLIYDPYRDEMFTAWKNAGAFMNGQRICCSTICEMADSVVCTGSPPNGAALAACLRATKRISHQVRSVRMLGSAAIMLAWVAAGRTAAYFDVDLNVWDHAAGALLVQEAGGRVSDAHGAPFTLTTRNLVASNGKIHDSLSREIGIARMWLE